MKFGRCIYSFKKQEKGKLVDLLLGELKQMKTY